MADDESITQRVARRIAEQQAADKPLPWWQRHLFELVLGVLGLGLLSLAAAGAVAYLNSIHVTRPEVVEQRIMEIDDEIATLEDYEAADPGSKYTPARQSGIRRKVAQKEALQRQLERLKE